MSRLHRIRIAMIVAGALLLALWVGWTPRQFSPEAWAGAADEDRETMAEDLIASRRLIGMDIREVPSLLGKPDDQTETMLIYTVDEGEGFNFYDYLDIRADSTGRVQRAFIRSD